MRSAAGRRAITTSARAANQASSSQWFLRRNRDQYADKVRPRRPRTGRGRVERDEAPTPPPPRTLAGARTRPPLPRRLQAGPDPECTCPRTTRSEPQGSSAGARSPTHRLATLRPRIYRSPRAQEHRFLRTGHTVIDLGAAPGGWSTVAARLVASAGSASVRDLRAPPTSLARGEDALAGSVALQRKADGAGRPRVSIFALGSAEVAKARGETATSTPTPTPTPIVPDRTALRPSSNRVIAVDLLPMEPVRGVDFLQGDFTRAWVQDAVLALLGARPCDAGASPLVPSPWNETMGGGRRWMRKGQRGGERGEKGERRQRESREGRGSILTRSVPLPVSSLGANIPASSSVSGRLRRQC